MLVPAVELRWMSPFPLFSAAQIGPVHAGGSMQTRSGE